MAFFIDTIRQPRSTARSLGSLGLPGTATDSRALRRTLARRRTRSTLLRASSALIARLRPERSPEDLTPGRSAPGRAAGFLATSCFLVGFRWGTLERFLEPPLPLRESSEALSAASTTEARSLRATAGFSETEEETAAFFDRRRFFLAFFPGTRAAGSRSGSISTGAHCNRDPRHRRGQLPCPSTPRCRRIHRDPARLRT